MPRKRPVLNRFELKKCPTGIEGIDEITGGGIPRGRPTLVTGGPGSGKTLIALEFLVKGVTLFNEPGVFMAFEETAEDLATNVSSLGFDLDGLVRQKKLAIDYVYIERAEIEDTGEYDLQGLFVRLGYAIDSIQAKRVVLDTIEVLFGSLPNEGILRAEIRRLMRWLKEKGVTAIVTGERGTATMTRYGLEEYVADCVIVLDHRVTEQISTRRLRVAKYRGSYHGTNEYPFLIDRDGVSVFPITSLELTSEARSEWISTGVAGLDAMLDGKGYYRASDILISGGAGTGKSTLATHLVKAACKRGERALYFAFEESPKQIVRNMLSVGIDLKPFMDRGCLLVQAERPTFCGLEMHLLRMTKLVNEFKPRVVVVDPITNLISVGLPADVRSMLTRLTDLFKTNQVTSVFTSLTAIGPGLDQSELGISSIMDTWIIVGNTEVQGRRKRVLTIVKSRGMSHSTESREFRLTERGLLLEEISPPASGASSATERTRSRKGDRLEVSRAPRLRRTDREKAR